MIDGDAHIKRQTKRKLERLDQEVAATVGAWPEADRKMRRERGGEGDGMMIVGAWMGMLRVTAGYGGDGRNLAGYERGRRKLERRREEARVDK
ncbi:hypothetical protein Tco_1063049 [Tanacetum coccineum]